MTATDTGRTRRPQLNDTITHLNDIIEGLSTAVPAVVADSLKLAFGAEFAAALGRAVADTLAGTVRDLVRAEVAAVRSELTPAMPEAETPTPTPLLAPQPPKPTWKARVRTVWTRVQAWAGRQLDAVLGVAIVGWAMLRLVAAAVAHSPAAVATAILSGLTFGVLAAVTEPAVAVALTAVSVGTLTASAVSAAPLVRAAVELDLDRDPA